jgi:CHASE3 domain sensor protein
MKMTFGIRAKLIAAFSIVAALTLLSSAVSLFAFKEFRSALEEVVDEKVPLMQQATNLQNSVQMHFLV